MDPNKITLWRTVLYGVASDPCSVMHTTEKAAIEYATYWTKTPLYPKCEVSRIDEELIAVHEAPTQP